MKIYDLSVILEPKDKVEAFGVEIEYRSHTEGGKDMLPFFNCALTDLPEGMGWSTERLTLSTHDGTHVDAPWHYGPVSQGKKARTIDELPMEWFYGDGVVVDFQNKKFGDGISTTDLKRALEKINYTIKPGDIVCIQTGADKYWGKREFFRAGCGLVRESTLWLINQGVRVIGTDAWGLDRPFNAIRTDFEKSRDKSIIWGAHFAGIEKEYCQIEKLANLDKLPKPFGFKISCFPVKIRGGSGGWVRVAAIFETD